MQLPFQIELLPIEVHPLYYNGTLLGDFDYASLNKFRVGLKRFYKNQPERKGEDTGFYMLFQKPNLNETQKIIFDTNGKMRAENNEEIWRGFFDFNQNCMFELL